MYMSLEIKQLYLEMIEAVCWFQQIEELRDVGPGEVHETDFWGIKDDNEVVALACIKPSESHITRIGVKPEYRRCGLASQIIETLFDEYGALELICRESLDANNFYENTGWEKVGTRWGDPEDLIEWEYTD